MRKYASLLLALTVVVGAAPAAAQEHQHENIGVSDPAAYSPELLEQLEAVRTATERFRDHDVAVAEGYERVGGDGPVMGEHWFRRDLVNEPFDIEKPSTLQYLRTGDEYVLTGVAYTAYRSSDDPLPEGFAGEFDVWHMHDMMKIAMAATEGRPLLRWLTERRIANGKTQWQPEQAELTMVHAWVWLDNPDGVFAQDHRGIPYVRLGLPADWARQASMAAANGVALLSDGACAQEVRRTNWLAVADWRQRRDMTRACEAAEGAVADAFNTLRRDGAEPDRDSVAAFNTAADKAWNAYLQERAAILTEEQLARLSIAIEHPGSHGGQRP